MTTFTIATGTSSFDGTAMGVVPGDKILLAAGTRGALTISNVHGAAGNEVEIRNAAGQVVINTGAGTGLQFDNCTHVRVSGRDCRNLGFFYGIRVLGWSTNGVWIHNQCEYFEMDHIEIGNSSGVSTSAGIRLYTYKSESATFVGHDYYIHDCYIHDCLTEAMYLNHHSTQTNPGRPIIGFEIAYCTVHDCGYEGIQIRYATDVEIHHNEVWNCGANVSGTGQVGAGIVMGNELGDCETHNNWIHDCVRGIYGLSYFAGCSIHHNLIVDVATNGTKDGRGIWMSDSNGMLIEHNTVVCTLSALVPRTVFGIRTPTGETDGIVKNNVVAGCNTNISTDYTETNNNTGTIASQAFLSGDPMYHLTVSSPARGNADDGDDCGWVRY